MNMIPVLARAFGVDPDAFERQVEAYEQKTRRWEAVGIDLNDLTLRVLAAYRGNLIERDQAGLADQAQMAIYQVGRLIGRAAAPEAENGRLRALARYAVHDRDCLARDGQDCSCGYAAALAPQSGDAGAQGREESRG